MSYQTEWLTLFRSARSMLAGTFQPFPAFNRRDKAAKGSVHGGAPRSGPAPLLAPHLRSAQINAAGINIHCLVHVPMRTTVVELWFGF